MEQWNKLLMVIFIITIFIRCNKETVDLSQIDKRNDIYYCKLEPDKPFTGYAVEYRKNNNIKRQDHEYKNGVLIHRVLYDSDVDGRIWKDFHFTDKGKKKEYVVYDVNYKNHDGYYGKLSEAVYYPNGKMKEEKQYETETEDNKLIAINNYDEEGAVVLQKAFLNDIVFEKRINNSKITYFLNGKEITENEFNNKLQQKDTHEQLNVNKSLNDNDIESNFSENPVPEILIIEGTNIWIRNKPITGDVVMKLNSGDKCKIIEKGEMATIKEKTDYWYKIEFEGKIGWVFGSQSDIKQK